MYSPSSFDGNNGGTKVENVEKQRRTSTGNNSCGSVFNGVPRIRNEKRAVIFPFEINRDGACTADGTLFAVVGNEGRVFAYRTIVDGPPSQIERFQISDGRFYFSDQRLWVFGTPSTHGGDSIWPNAETADDGVVDYSYTTQRPWNAANNIAQYLRNENSNRRSGVKSTLDYTEPDGD